MMKVYKYGCRRPTEGAELLADQLQKAHDYYNGLIDIEVARRKAFRNIRTQFSADVSRLEAQIEGLSEKIDEVYTEWKKARSSARKRIDAPPLREELTALKAERKRCGEELKTAKLEFKERLTGGDEDFSLRVQKRAKELQPADSDSETPGPTIIGKAKLEIWEQMLAEPWPDAWLLKARSDRDAVVATHKLREESGVSPGTYLLTGRAFDLARKSPTDPERRRWDGSGQVGVQLRPALTPARLVEPNNWVEIRQIDPKWRSRGKRLARHVRVRIASGDKKAPLWVELPVILHRPLPPDAQVKWAAVVVKRVGNRTRYELQLSVDTAYSAGRCGQGTVAIDVGWRRMPSGDLRVGYCFDSYGHGWSLELPGKFVDDMLFIDRLKNITDTQFDLAKAVAIAALPTAPSSIVQRLQHLHQWRSHARLAKVAYQWVRTIAPEQRISEIWKRWELERIPMEARSRKIPAALRPKKLDLMASYDELSEWFAKQGITDAAPWYLEWWRLKNRHIYQWECDARRRVLARRLDLYRNMAAQLSARYEKLIIENFDLRSVARRPTTDQHDDATHEAARHLRQLAAVSQLRNCLGEAFGGKRTERIKKKNPARTTLVHHGCGHDHSGDEEFRQATIASPIVTCKGCGQDFDQDYSAAQNLLSERFSGDETPGTSRKREKSSSSSSLGNAAE